MSKAPDDFSNPFVSVEWIILLFWLAEATDVACQRASYDVWPSEPDDRVELDTVVCRTLVYIKSVLETRV